VDWVLDLGSVEDQGHLEEHLAERGLTLHDVWSVAAGALPRRKGDRILLFGRGSGGTPLVVVVVQIGTRWRPKTAWQMDDVERRWWRAHGGT
jgi:hypothetical protein